MKRLFEFIIFGCGHRVKVLDVSVQPKKSGNITTGHNKHVLMICKRCGKPVGSNDQNNPPFRNPRKV